MALVSDKTLHLFKESSSYVELFALIKIDIAKSGGSVKSFCENNKIDRKSFWRWEKGLTVPSIDTVDNIVRKLA